MDDGVPGALGGGGRAAAAHRGQGLHLTLIATVGAEIIELVRTIAAQPNGEPSSPFVSLAVTAILYAVFLGWFKHKYGG